MGSGNERGDGEEGEKKETRVTQRRGQLSFLIFSHEDIVIFC